MLTGSALGRPQPIAQSQTPAHSAVEDSCAFHRDRSSRRHARAPCRPPPASLGPPFPATPVPVTPRPSHPLRHRRSIAARAPPPRRPRPRTYARPWPRAPAARCCLSLSLPAVPAASPLAQHAAATRRSPPSPLRETPRPRLVLAPTLAAHACHGRWPPEAHSSSVAPAGHTRAARCGPSVCTRSPGASAASTRTRFGRPARGLLGIAPVRARSAGVSSNINGRRSHRCQPRPPRGPPRRAPPPAFSLGLAPVCTPSPLYMPCHCRRALSSDVPAPFPYEPPRLPLA